VSANYKKSINIFLKKRKRKKERDVGATLETLGPLGISFPRKIDILFRKPNDSHGLLVQMTRS
jgi:hypothetical protein